VFWIIYQLKRQHVLRQLSNVITDDMSAYNTVWRSLQSAEVGQDLLRLEESVIEVQERSSSKHMRYQRQRYLTKEEMH
jgi:regulation of enolase protein 1 (concanavalin A-like superfamily)